MTPDQAYSLGQYINVFFIPHTHVFAGMVTGMMLVLTVLVHLQDIFKRLEQSHDENPAPSPVDRSRQ
jgi:hypothetical protein